MFNKTRKKQEEILRTALHILQLSLDNLNYLHIIGVEIEDKAKNQSDWFRRIHNSQAQTNKLLMARDASLDNNFEGKTEL